MQRSDTSLAEQLQIANATEQKPTCYLEKIHKENYSALFANKMRSISICPTCEVQAAKQKEAKEKGTLLFTFLFVCDQIASLETGSPQKSFCGEEE